MGKNRRERRHLAALVVAAGENSRVPTNAVKSLRKAHGGTQTAWVKLPVATAKKIAGEHGKIKIGWVNCRIRGVERPLKCYKCWDFGHLANHCKGEVDRSKLCIKCGEGSHLVSKCQTDAKCALCVAKGRTDKCTHIAGSSRCPVYKEAVQAVTKKRK
ncbi:DNA-binding protein HEXBP-like [Diachasma alloeum]|uniref:DNA-binding protein HEXBP-like n=1 Tax=Diachasma alloeum TaxID=454923 RepID=UPI0007381A7B|nr:DNA-binding protein HEXBP-like [Diachasma alloeum]